MKHIRFVDEKGTELTTLDFGEIKDGESVSKKIFVHNFGRGTLHKPVIELSPELAKYCQQPTSPDRIKPGETFPINITASIREGHDVAQILGKVTIKGKYKVDWTEVSSEASK